MPTIDEIDAQIRALEDQKRQIAEKAKQQQLDAANKAIEELRKLGYNYRLLEGGNGTGNRTQPASSGTGTRRTGIRDRVLQVVKDAPDGISASDVLKKMEATSDADKTAVRNALSALKKNGSIGLANGSYSAA